MKSLIKNKLRKRDVVHSVLTGILLTSLLFNSYFIFMNFNRNRVVRVVDGDSFETKDGRRIRLLGLDAPEINNCMGFQAKDVLEILISGKVVSLKDQVRDDYGRNLANVFTISTFVNKEMIKRGLGKYNSGDKKYEEELRNAYLAAKDKELGIFSALCRQMEEEPG